MDARKSVRVEDQPIYWFSILDAALHRGDLETAARASRELERLGVRVNYGRQEAHA